MKSFESRTRMRFSFRANASCAKSESRRIKIYYHPPTLTTRTEICLVPVFFRATALALMHINAISVMLVLLVVFAVYMLINLHFYLIYQKMMINYFDLYYWSLKLSKYFGIYYFQLMINHYN